MPKPCAEALRELSPTGALRAAINFGNPVLAQRGSAGEPAGVTVDLAHELGRQLGLPVSLVAFDAAGKVFEAAAAGAWDVCFLAVDPARANEILFTDPYVIIEATCIVPASAPVQSFQDLDRPGARIAVGKGAAYELYLSRTAKHATLVHAGTSADAVILFHRDGLDAAAGVRQPLLDYAAAHPELRVLDERLTVIRQAMGTPQGRPAARAYLESFIEDMKRSGFVAAALARSGQRDATVAPLR